MKATAAAAACFLFVWFRAGAQADAKPSIILFSVDDTVLPSAWHATYQQTIVASQARNPNGCRPPVTWFSSCCAHGRNTSDCATARLAHSRGHELATHTASHSRRGADFGYAEWVQEAGGQRAWLTDSCGIPAEDVVGFRAPYFQHSEVLGTVLRDLGFLYDSSLTGRAATQPGHRLSAAAPWPYDYCAQPEGGGPRCGNWSALDVWEVPAYVLPGRGPQVGRRVDPSPADGMGVLQRLQADWRRKAGTGVPVPVAVHEAYLRDDSTRRPLVQFFAWASRQPDTWFLTFRQYIAYLAAPPGTQVSDVVAAFVCDH